MWRETRMAWESAEVTDPNGRRWFRGPQGWAWWDGHGWVLDPRGPQMVPAAPARKNSKTSISAIVVAVVACTITVIVVAVLIARDPSGSTSPASSGGPAPSAPSLPAGSAPPSVSATSAPTTASQIAAALNVSVIGESALGHTADSDNNVVLTFSVHNTSAKPIAAYQTSTDLSVTDSLGRTYSQHLLSDCTDPLGPGESRTGPTQLSESTIAAAVKDCTLGTWTMNQFDPEQIGLWTAMQSARGSYSLRITRITFADGSSLGTAETGTPGP